MVKQVWMSGLCVAGAIAVTAAQGTQKPVEIVVIGCLERSGQGFAMKDYRSGALHVLEAKPEMIDWHVGHKIEVKGTVQSGSKPESIRVKVESVAYISPTCS
jgi:hypothetical protein